MIFLHHKWCYLKVSVWTIAMKIEEMSSTTTPGERALNLGISKIELTISASEIILEEDASGDLVQPRH